MQTAIHFPFRQVDNRIPNEADVWADDVAELLEHDLSIRFDECASKWLRAHDQGYIGLELLCARMWLIRGDWEPDELDVSLFHQEPRELDEYDKMFNVWDLLHYYRQGQFTTTELLLIMQHRSGQEFEVRKYEHWRNVEVTL